jgi:hypothetical protein
LGQRWGLNNRINKGIATKKLTKRTPPPSPLDKMDGATNYKKSLIYHLHQFGHEVQHPNLYSFLPTIEVELCLLIFLSSK